MFIFFIYVCRKRQNKTTTPRGDEDHYTTNNISMESSIASKLSNAVSQHDITYNDHDGIIVATTTCSQDKLRTHSYAEIEDDDVAKKHGSDVLSMSYAEIGDASTGKSASSYTEIGGDSAQGKSTLTSYAEISSYVEFNEQGVNQGPVMDEGDEYYEVFDEHGSHGNTMNKDSVSKNRQGMVTSTSSSVGSVENIIYETS